MQASNFSFLAEHSPLMADLGATAEKLYPFDPASCVLKLRLLAGALTQDVAARVGVKRMQPTQAELLRAVDQRLGLDPQLRQMFHLLRQRGNEAAHQIDQNIGYREGMEALKLVREVALWFHRTFGSNPNFRPGPFVLPDDPSQQLASLQQKIAALQSDLHNVQNAQATQGEMAKLLEAQAAQEREMAARTAEERAIFESLAEEASARYAERKAEFDAKLKEASAQITGTGAAEVKNFAERASQAAKKVALDEASTRLIIDQMLQDAGWQADTLTLTHAKRIRPEPSKNLAIAEWPTQGKQSADYMLFAGLTSIAAAKAKRINVAGNIAQPQRYAAGITTKKTRKREFLDEMNLVVSWSQLVTPITHQAPARGAKGGRLPFAVETRLLRGRVGVRQPPEMKQEIGIAL